MISAIAGQWEKPICLPHGLCWNCLNQSRKAEKNNTKMGHMEVRDQGPQTSKVYCIIQLPIFQFYNLGQGGVVTL